MSRTSFQCLMYVQFTSNLYVQGVNTFEYFKVLSRLLLPYQILEEKKWYFVLKIFTFLCFWWMLKLQYILDVFVDITAIRSYYSEYFFRFWGSVNMKVSDKTVINGKYFQLVFSSIVDTGNYSQALNDFDEILK